MARNCWSVLTAIPASRYAGVSSRTMAGTRLVAPAVPRAPNATSSCTSAAWTCIRTNCGTGRRPTTDGLGMQGRSRTAQAPFTLSVACVYGRLGRRKDKRNCFGVMCCRKSAQTCRSCLSVLQLQTQLICELGSGMVFRVHGFNPTMWTKKEMTRSRFYPPTNP